MGKFECADSETSPLHRNGQPHSPASTPVCDNASAAISPANSAMSRYDDAIYGTIQLPALVKSIIGTRHFRRLAQVYQLGFLRFPYEEANITRYQHCIGTYYAATCMLKALEENSAKEFFSHEKWPLYRLAVQLAALMHDVGHGPGSHSWEFVCAGAYEHEDVSLECVDRIFEELPLTECALLRADNNFGIELIKALIVADKTRVPGFPDEYGFIFEIVNNRDYKADVDKWDYLKRDYNALQAHSAYPLNVDFDDVFLKARVSEDGSHIAYRYEDGLKFYHIFETRYEMWRQFYCSAQSKCRDIMFARMVNRSQDGKLYKMIRPSAAEEFLRLTDDTVLDSLKPDNWYKALTGEADLEEATPEADQENVLSVDVVIPGPGTYMPPLPPLPDCVHFYGNPGDMPVFEQNREPLVVRGRYVVPQLN